MAKKSKKESKPEENAVQDDAWISQRMGNRIIAVVSIALAIWTAWQSAPAVGLWEAIMWGVIFGAAIWVIFYGTQRFQRWIRRR